MEVHFIDDKIERFIDSLDIGIQTKIGRMVGLLEKYGNRIGSSHSKKVAYGLFELRIRGTIEIRILYAFRGQKILILHGFIKKTRKIPRKEIDVALGKLKMFANL